MMAADEEWGKGKEVFFSLSVPAPEDHGIRIAKVPGPILPVNR